MFTPLFYILFNNIHKRIILTNPTNVSNLFICFGIGKGYWWGIYNCECFFFWSTKQCFQNRNTSSSVKKLEAYRINGVELKWFESYPLNRNQLSDEICNEFGAQLAATWNGDTLTICTSQEYKRKHFEKQRRLGNNKNKN